MSNFSVEERIRLAKEKTQKLVDHTSHLISIHENNKIILYSKILTDQIPESFAANAFNVLQESLYGFELVRLCVLWDKPRKDDFSEESIPSVCGLVSDPQVLQVLRDEARLNCGAFSSDQLGGQKLSNGLLDKIKKSHDERADEYAAHQESRLACAIRAADRVVKSNTMVSVRNYRDKYLVHSLSATQREKRQGVVNLPKYGDEVKLLRLTQRIVSLLYGGVCGIGYSFDDSHYFARRCASELWGNCKIKLPSQGLPV